MKSLALSLAALFLLSGCGMSRSLGRIEVIAETQRYAVGDASDGLYVIIAADSTSAREASTEVLRCDTEICILGDQSVIWLIEKPIQSSLDVLSDVDLDD